MVHARRKIDASIETLEPRQLYAAGEIDQSFRRIVENAALIRADLRSAVVVDVAIDRTGRSVIFGNLQDGTGAARRSIMFVARFLADGAADLSFGSFGMQTVDLAAGSQLARSVAVDDALRINLAFDADVDNASMMHLAQLNETGTLNRRFGRRGVTLPRFGPDSHAVDLAIDNQNNIVFSADVARQIGVGKLTPTGRQHPDFGTRSTRIIPGTLEATASSTIPTADGFYVGATLPGRRGMTDFGVISLDTAGLFAGTFGNGGIARVNIGGSREKLDSLILDSRGRLLLTGRRGLNEQRIGLPPSLGGPDAIVTAARLTPAGALDATFNRGGVATGNNWAAAPDELENFATRFDAPPAIGVEAAGLYRIYNQGVRFEVTNAGRRFGDIGVALVSDRRLTQVPTNTSAAAVATSGDRIVVVTHGGNDVASEFNSNLIIGSSAVFRDDGSYNFPAQPMQIASEVARPVVLADGSLVALLESRDRHTYFRFNRDGSFDTTFGGDGLLEENDADYRYGNLTYRPQLFQLGDGSFYVAYESQDSTDSDPVAALIWRISGKGVQTLVDQTNDETRRVNVRLLPFDAIAYSYESTVSKSGDAAVAAGDGSLHGTYFSEFDATHLVPDAPRDGAISANDGVFYVSGTIVSEGNPDVPFIAKINEGPTQTLDSAFGNAGVLTGLAGVPLHGQPTGALLYTRPGFDGLYRLTATGVPDRSFGVRGAMGPAYDHYTLDQSGRIIAWRQIKGGTSDGAVEIARFDANGKVEATFGQGGLIAVNTGFDSTATANVIVDAGGRLVVTAVQRNSTDASWSAVRILSD